MNAQSPTSEGSDDDQAGAFNRLYRETFSQVLAYCRRRCRDVSEADDAASETFMVAWRRLDQVLAADSEIAWLYGVAYRVLSNQRRTIGRRGRLQFKLDRQRPDPSLGDPLDAITSSGDIAAAFEALNRLSATDQELIRLVAFEKLSYAEIAAMTGMRVGSVRSRLYRARRQLEESASKKIVRDFSQRPDTEPDERAANPSSGAGES